MQESWLGLLGKVLLWLGCGLFPIILVASIAVPPDSGLGAWREFLAVSRLRHGRDCAGDGGQRIRRGR